MNRSVITSNLDSQATNGVTGISSSNSSQQQNLTPALAATAAAAAATGAFDYAAYYNQPWMLNSGLNQQLVNQQMQSQQQPGGPVQNQQLQNQIANANINIPTSTTIPGSILPSLQTVTDSNLANSVYDPANMVGANMSLPVSAANPNNFMGSAAAALRNMSAAAIYSQQNTAIDYNQATASQDYSNNLAGSYPAPNNLSENNVQGQSQPQQNPTSTSNFDNTQYPVYRKF